MTADARDQAGGPAKRRINITERRDLQAFAAELGCSTDELKRAVAQVGNIVSDVAIFLRAGKLKSTHSDNERATAAVHSLFKP